MELFLPNGPTVWRVSYGFQFEQFETLPKAINYIEENLKNKEKHMLTIQKVNLKQIIKPEFERMECKLGR